MPDYSKRIVVEPKASWQRPVIAIQNTPPSSPNKGDRYLVGTEGSGDWSGKDNQIAVWDGTQWIFDIPSEGWFVWILALDALYQHTGTAWIEYPIHTHENKTILDLIEEALTAELKERYDEAHTKRAKYDEDLGVVYFEL